MLRDITRIFYNSEGAASCDVAALFPMLRVCGGSCGGLHGGLYGDRYGGRYGRSSFIIDLKIREDKIISRERRFYFH